MFENNEAIDPHTNEAQGDYLQNRLLSDNSEGYGLGGGRAEQRLYVLGLIL